MSTTTLLSIVVPLSAVPLTVTVFYLRSLRHLQGGWHRDLTRRLDAAEARMAGFEARLAAVHRDCTSKEEWLRESLYTRGHLHRLGEDLARWHGGHRNTTNASPSNHTPDEEDQE